MADMPLCMGSSAICGQGRSGNDRIDGSLLPAGRLALTCSRPPPLKPRARPSW